MKKFISVLLAMLMIFSVMTVAFAADDEVAPPQQNEEVADGEADGESTTPDWLTKLINRLMEVLTKLLTKLGLKLVIKGTDISDLIGSLTQKNPSEPAPQAPAAA